TRIRRPRRSPRFPYTTLFRSTVNITGGQIRKLTRITGDNAQGRSRRSTGGGLCTRNTAEIRSQRSGSHKQQRPRSTGNHRTTGRSEEHTSELQSRENLVCRLL